MRSKRYLSKTIAILTAVCMVISTLAMTGPPITAWADGPSGGGSDSSDPWEQDISLPGDPYLIRSDADLIELCKPANSGYWGYNFLQVEDIDLKDILEIVGWTPIGNLSNRFTGTYDGGGYTISNLTVNDTLESVGLFGYVGENGTLTNIRLENVSVTSSVGYAGGLAGVSSGIVEYCGSSGSVAGGSANLGGLIGYNEGVVSNSYSACNITGGDETAAGGLIGYSGSGTVNNNYSTGSVSGGYVSLTGGLIGLNVTGIVSNNYSTGSVTAEDESAVGGLIGLNDTGTVSNNYSAGRVSGGSGTYKGGLIGYNDGSDVTNSYYLDTAEGGSAAGTALTAAEMKRQASFVGWDFDPGTDWRIMEGYTYPVLQWQGQTTDEDIALDAIALDWDAIKGTNSTENNVTENLVLPATGTNGTTITWNADPAGYINTSTSVVTRPAYGTGDKTVTLSAIVSKAGGMSQSKEFTLTVKEAPRTGNSNNNGSSSGNGTLLPPPVSAPVSGEKLEIPAGFLANPAAGGTMTLNSNIGSVIVPSNMLVGVPGAEGKKAEILIGEGDKSDLPPDVKAAIGDRPLISLSLLLDGAQNDWNNPGAPVTVSIPYAPTPEELANSEGIVVWYIDGSGSAVCVPNGRYDPATGKVIFDVTHFSDYAVVYNKVSFGDVPAGAWYGKAVPFIAARDITTGTGGGNFSPGAKLTRGQFLVMLMKAYEIVPDKAGSDNFADAGNTYYTGFLAAAKRLGISGGVGDNMFAPEEQITRQEMFTLLYNALKAIGQLSQTTAPVSGGGAGRTLSDFSDADQVASWAEEALTLLVETGTVSGSGGKLSPKAVATRAEMAQVLYGLLSK